jgi:hypothetical protein
MERNGLSRLCWVLGIALALGGCVPSDEERADLALPGGWQQEFLGSEPGVVFFPDRNVNYWTYRLNRTRAGNHVGIRIQGAYPQARYLGINIYDNSTLSPVASMVDVAIAADPGSVNPFLQEEWHDHHPAGYYTVDVVPEGTVVPGAANVIEYPDDLEAVSIFLRYYLAGPDPRGGFPLPTLSAFDTRTGEPLDFPQPAGKPLEARTRLEAFLQRLAVDYAADLVAPWFDLNLRERLLAYRPSAAGLFGNRDNLYLTIPVTKKPDEVAVLRFRPPSFPRRNGEIGEADVRYWSLSLGDRDTFNYWTLSDAEARVADDGYVYVVTGPPVPELLEKAGKYNVIPWELGDQGVLVYRNLLTREGFRGAISRVPELGDGRFTRSFSAGLYIGEYAPDGVLMPLEEFLAAE